MIVRLVIFLVAASGILAGARAYLLRNEPLPPLPAAAVVDGADSAVAAPVATSPEIRARIEHLVNRPPFAPDRRPEPVETAAAPEAAAPAAVAPISARLLGVIQDRGERFAVLATGPTQETAIVRHGGQIDGWTVEIIDDNRVVLRKDKARVEILLFEAK